MNAYAEVLSYAIVFFIICIILEWGISRLMKRDIHTAMDTISSLSSGLTNTIKDILKLTITIVFYTTMLDHLALFTIETTWLVYIVAFIGIDFAQYWSHRWSHEINVFWNRHIIHHSSEEFNLPAALRQPFGAFIGIFFFLNLPMAIIGIPNEVIQIVLPLHLFAQFWYHTKLIDKMGFLEYIIVTPSHHRVHHAINDEYLDKNYAAIFIVWDKLFGTFQAELKDVPAVYGVKKAVQTWNPFLINFMHFWQLAKDAWHTKKLWDKIRLWFMPTGWRPTDVNEKYPIDYTKDPFTQIKYAPKATTGLKLWAAFQLLFHNALLYHLIQLLPTEPYSMLFYYGLFLLVSIFAYTTLMDRSPLAIPVEFIKLIFGIGLFYYMNSWYGLELIIPYGSGLMLVYIIISMMVTIWYSIGREVVDNQLDYAG